MAMAVSFFFPIKMADKDVDSDVVKICLGNYWVDDVLNTCVCDYLYGKMVQHSLSSCTFRSMEMVQYSLYRNLRITYMVRYVICVGAKDKIYM